MELPAPNIIPKPISQKQGLVQRAAQLALTAAGTVQPDRTGRGHTQLIPDRLGLVGGDHKGSGIGIKPGIFVVASDQHAGVAAGDIAGCFLFFAFILLPLKIHYLMINL